MGIKRWWLWARVWAMALLVSYVVQTCNWHRLPVVR